MTYLILLLRGQLGKCSIKSIWNKDRVITKATIPSHLVDYPALALSNEFMCGSVFKKKTQNDDLIQLLRLLQRLSQ